MPCSSSTSNVRSASSWLTRASEAAPKIIRVLECPVRPNGRLVILIAGLLLWEQLVHDGRVYPAVRDDIEALALDIGVVGVERQGRYRAFVATPRRDGVGLAVDLPVLLKGGLVNVQPGVPLELLSIERLVRFQARHGSGDAPDHRLHDFTASGLIALGGDYALGHKLEVGRRLVDRHQTLLLALRGVGECQHGALHPA